MATFLKGITGSYRGRVGNIVGSSWRGIDYIRSLPRKSSKPASPDQQAQRARFGMTTSFLKSIKDILMVGYADSKLRGKTGYNVAFQHFIQNAIVGTFPSYTIEYSLVQIAKGGLANLLALEVMESFPQVLSFSWQPEVNRFNAYSDDQVIVLLYNEADNLFSAYEGAARIDAAFEVALPPSYTGKTIVGWTFNIHRDGKTTSNSQYIGEIVLT